MTNNGDGLTLERERKSSPEKYYPSPDDFFMSAAYSADSDTETAVQCCHDVDMTIHRKFSGHSRMLQEK